MPDRGLVKMVPTASPARLDPAGVPGTTDPASACETKRIGSTMKNTMNQTTANRTAAAVIQSARRTLNGEDSVIHGSTTFAAMPATLTGRAGGLR